MRIFRCDIIKKEVVTSNDGKYCFEEKTEPCMDCDLNSDRVRTTKVKIE